MPTACVCVCAVEYEKYTKRNRFLCVMSYSSPIVVIIGAPIHSAPMIIVICTCNSREFTYECHQRRASRLKTSEKRRISERFRCNVETMMLDSENRQSSYSCIHLHSAHDPYQFCSARYTRVTISLRCD